MAQLKRVLTVSDAAKKLGVSAQTLRNWADSGKLRAQRHPMNGYRLFDPSEVDRLIALTSFQTERFQAAMGVREDPTQFNESEPAQLQLGFQGASNDDYSWLSSSSPSNQNKGRRIVRIADVFCGAGVFSLGVDRALRSRGITPAHVFGIDFDANAIATFAHNYPHSRAIHADILSIANGEFGARKSMTEKSFSADVGDIDILLGGPPCQGHSDLNNHTRRIDPKNELYFAMVRLAEIIRPQMILIENVPGVLHDAGRVVSRTVDALQLMGYQVSYSVVDLEKIGVPQKRKRLALIGTLRTTVDLDAAVAMCTTAPRPVSWAIGDLLDEYDESSIYCSASKHSAENQRRINYLFEHELFELPNSERPPCHRDKKHSYLSVYGRMNWNAPAPTITGGFGSTGQGRFVHPLIPRTLTPHEACRLQFIPDFFSFPNAVKRRSMQQLIGNAAPPKLSQAIIEQALRQRSI